MISTISDSVVIDELVSGFSAKLADAFITWDGKEGDPESVHFFDYDVSKRILYITFNRFIMDQLSAKHPGVFNINPTETVSVVLKEQLLVKVLTDSGEVTFSLHDPEFNLENGLLGAKAPDSIHKHLRRSRERINPPISDAPEIVIMTDDDMVDVPVMDISPDGVRIMLPGFEWHKVLSPSKLNRCLIRIPGASEYYAMLEFRHKKYSVPDRLDSPIEIGCQFRELNEVGRNALKKYCNRIVDKMNG